MPTAGLGAALAAADRHCRSRAAQAGRRTAPARHHPGHHAQDDRGNQLDRADRRSPYRLGDPGTDLDGLR